MAVEGAVENGLFNGILQSLGIKPPSRTPPQEFGHFIHKNTVSSRDVLYLHTVGVLSHLELYIRQL